MLRSPNPFPMLGKKGETISLAPSAVLAVPGILKVDRLSHAFAHMQPLGRCIDHA